MTASTTTVFREHVAGSKRFRHSIRDDEAKSKAFLIKAGKGVLPYQDHDPFKRLRDAIVHLKPRGVRSSDGRAHKPL